MGNFIDISGHQYGKWTVLLYQENGQWLCRCQCGNTQLVTSWNLRNGKSTQCMRCRSWKGYGEISATYWQKLVESAAARQHEFGLSIEDAWRQFLEQKRRCALTGLELTFYRMPKDAIDQTASLDRIDNARGYVPGNIQWVHKTINRMKGNLNEEEFIDFCQLVGRFMERKYTNDPCPECHKHGTATGFVVNRDCKVCSGTGYKPANAS